MVHAARLEECLESGSQMAFAIHDPALRAALEIRQKPYFVRIADGLHLGYRKGKSVSRWVVRRSRNGTYQMRTVAGVQPDDHFPPDGTQTLSFQQMVNRLMTEGKNRICCSFCGKGPKVVAKLIAGPGVFICDGCVAMCQLYIDNPADDARLLIEDGKPVIHNGKPVFVPLTEEELRQRDELLAEED